jgi:hypothetical protein
MHCIVQRTHRQGQPLELGRMDGPYSGRVHMYSQYRADLRRQVVIMELAGEGNPGQPNYRQAIPQLLDPAMLTFNSEKGMVITGFEELSGARYYQGWWLQWFDRLPDWYVKTSGL